MPSHQRVRHFRTGSAGSASASAAARVIWHYGQWAQYSALYIKVPEQRLTLILLANSGGLGEAFPLAAGDVMVSPFARAFLGLFL